MLNLPLTHDFTGKVVVVTGAGGVLCGDMARAYAQAGAIIAQFPPPEKGEVSGGRTSVHGTCKNLQILEIIHKNRQKTGIYQSFPSIFPFLQGISSQKRSPNFGCLNKNRMKII